MAEPHLFPHAPEELLSQPLIRLGEGVGTVVYASPHWVIRRERSPREIVALILLWKLLRKVERHLPAALGARLVRRPARQIRILRLFMQTSLLVFPRSLWLGSHVRDIWRLYRKRSLRGAEIAQTHLEGTPLVPEHITFPPTRVRVKGWPGWLTVSEATERVEATLFQRLSDLGREHRFEEVEVWLDRFLVLRQRGWERGVFSVDAHLKNFGVMGEHIVLLDPGGLTNRWPEIEEKLSYEEVVTQPHIQLGLGPLLGARPEIAARFDSRWKAIVNREVVRRHWAAARPDLAV